MPVPQVLQDLPYATYLQAFDGELAQADDYTELLFADTEFADFDAGGCHLGQSALVGVTFTNGALPRARLNDVWFNRSRWVGVDAAQTDWLDVTVLGSFLAGVQAHGAKLRRVTFQECKIDTLNLRGAAVRDVVFDRCELTELDLAEARLTNVTFPGSALRRLRLRDTALTKVDFRGAAELDLAAGHEFLRGSVIDSGQLIELAPALAQTLGIVVNDR